MYVYLYMIKFRICDAYIILFVQNISTNKKYYILKLTVLCIYWISLYIMKNLSVFKSY